MIFSNFSKRQFKNLDEDEVNTILRLTHRDYSVIKEVDEENYKYLSRHAGKIFELDDGSYLNLLYGALKVNCGDLELLSKKTKKVWNILNKEAIDNKEDTTFVKTLVIAGLPMKDEDKEVLCSTPNYSISQVSTYDLTAIKEFRPIDLKMFNSGKNDRFKHPIDYEFIDMDIGEVNALLEMFNVEITIKELVDIDFDAPNVGYNNIVGRKDDGDYVCICITFDEPNGDLIENQANIAHHVYMEVNKDNDGKPFEVESFVIDMGANIR